MAGVVDVGRVRVGGGSATMGHVTVHPATPEGVAVVQLTSPPVNALGPAVLQELWAAMRGLQADASIKAIVVTGSPKADREGRRPGRTQGAGATDCGR